MEKYDVVIIGAGAAGLSAARKCKEAGKKIIVLEAMNRIGGRIHTIRERGVVEAGAEFIHGEHAVTWNLIKATGLRTEEWKSSNGTSFEHVYGEHGRIQDISELAEADTLWAEVYDYKGPDISLTDYISSKPYSQKAKELVKGRVARLESATPEILSVLGVASADREATNGDKNFWLPDGYDQVVSEIEQGVDIRLDHPVVRIVWEEGKAIVYTENGNEFEGKAVLVTIPLGVMQEQPPKFEPALPESFHTALHRIGYGNVTKPTFWIEGKIEPFQILSTNHPVNFWQRTFTNETVVVGYTGITLATTLAELSEEESLAIVLDALADALGSEIKQRIRHMRHFTWAGNPYIRGAYSYPRVGMGNARTVIRESIEKTIYYAGEATHTKGHASTVNGAIEEGRDAAERILKHI